MSDKERRIIKCPGRFSGFREYLHNEAVPIVLKENTSIEKQDLIDIWDLISSDIYQFDNKDSYYHSKVDKARKDPINLEHLSLVPLFPSHFDFKDNLIYDYVLAMGNKPSIVKYLVEMSKQPGRFFQNNLNRDPSNIFLPCDKNMSGYIISANIGIGTASSGGVQEGGIRSDSPFLLEIYKLNRFDNEQSLAAVIGFWAQDNAMLVSQMQSCRNASLPEGVPFGVACLKIAEVAACLMGFDKIFSYSARAHPIFFEHPENWKQFGPEFVQMWDNSARKLKYSDTDGRNGHYEKMLNHDKC